MQRDWKESGTEHATFDGKMGIFAMCKLYKPITRLCRLIGSDKFIAHNLPVLCEQFIETILPEITRYFIEN